MAFKDELQQLKELIDLFGGIDEKIKVTEADIEKNFENYYREEYGVVDKQTLQMLVTASLLHSTCIIMTFMLGKLDKDNKGPPTALSNLLTINARRMQEMYSSFGIATLRDMQEKAAETFKGNLQ